MDYKASKSGGVSHLSAHELFGAADLPAGSQFLGVLLLSLVPCVR